MKTARYLPRLRKAALVASVLAGAALAGASTGLLTATDEYPLVELQEPLISGSEAPLHSGSLYVCNLPIRAYAGGVFYPPNHPAAPPSTERIEWCFATAESAEEAGYSLAPAPEGGEVFGGIYIVPLEAEVWELCIDAARGMGIPVPCPPQVPASFHHASYRLTCSSGEGPPTPAGCNTESILHLGGEFPMPDASRPFGYTEAGSFSLTVRQRAEGDNPTLYCGGRPPVSQPVIVGGKSADLLSCPRIYKGQFAGVRWSEGRHDFEIRIDMPRPPSENLAGRLLIRLSGELALVGDRLSPPFV